MRDVRVPRPSAAVVISIIALVVAMSGAGYAALNVPKNSVGTKQLKNNAVTTKKIKNGAVTGSKMNFNGVTVPNTNHANSADNATTAGIASTLQGHPPGDFATVASEAYHEVGAAGEPGFENGWHNFSSGIWSTAAFYKDSQGVVHLKGTMTAGTFGVAAFTLPVGYRPAKNLDGAGGSAAGAGTLFVDSDGDVVPNSGSAAFGLDGFTFRAGA